MRASFMAVVLAAAGCGGSSGYGAGGGYLPACSASTATATTSVALAGFTFVPSCVKVPAGATVTFTDDDPGTLHTVTTDAGQAVSFDSGNLSQGQVFTHTFAAPGTVDVHCTYHAAMGMRAAIIVQ